MQKFEYKKTRDLSEEELNELGAEGWELVAIHSSFEICCVFKRPLVEESKLPSTEELMKEAIREWGFDSKLGQVKHIKEKLKIGLKEAKDIVDEYHRTHTAFGNHISF